MYSTEPPLGDEDTKHEKDGSFDLRQPPVASTRLLCHFTFRLYDSRINVIFLVNLFDVLYKIRAILFFYSNVMYTVQQVGPIKCGKFKILRVIGLCITSLKIYVFSFVVYK